MVIKRLFAFMLIAAFVVGFVPSTIVYAQPEVSEDPRSLVRVCEAEDNFWSVPAPRLAELAVELGGLANVVSACAESYDSAMAATGRQIAEALNR